MLDRLNEDCLLRILKYVGVKEQLALAKISESLHCNVQYHWRRLKKANLNEDILAHFKQRPEEMHDFLECASGSLQDLVLHRIGESRQTFEAWKNYSFPNMRSLDCSLWYSCDEEQADEMSFVLTKLFPNLTKLTIQSSTSGRFLWRWGQLEELHLVCCESLDTSTFPRIFSTLPLRKLTLLFYGYNVTLDEGVLPASKCTTLEELVIDDHHLLGAFLPNLMQLPSFRRLAFYTRDYYEGLLQTTANLQPLKVQSLFFHDAFWSSSRVCDAIVRMSNLKKLALHDDDIETSQLYGICSKLSNLEELHLTHMRSLPTPTQIWDIVEACDSLKLLNLSHCKLNELFLDHSKSCLDRVLQKRNPSTALTLHMHNTKPARNPEEIMQALKHPNLKVLFNALNLDIWSSCFIEIGFTPSVM